MPTVRVRPGEWVDLPAPKVGKVEVGDVVWTIPSGTGEIDGSSYLAGDMPVGPVVPITGTSPTVPGTWTVDARIVLPWPDGWPYCENGTGGRTAWDSDDLGKRAMKVLYGLLDALPEHYRTAVGRVPIYRVPDTELKKEEGAIYHPFFHEVKIRESTVQQMGGLYAPKLEKSEPWLAHTMVHELSHALAHEESAAHTLGLLEAIGSLWERAGKLLSTGNPGGLVLVPLMLPAAFGLVFTLPRDVFASDFMTEWCEATGWRIRGAFPFGVVGWLFSGVWPEQSPNYVFSGPVGHGWGLHNLKLPAGFARQSLDSGDAKYAGWTFPADKKKVEDLLDTGGFVSLYATDNAQEDLSETTAIVAFGPDAIEKANIDMTGTKEIPDPADPTKKITVPAEIARRIFQDPDKARRDFLAEREYFPKTWTPITDAVLAKYLQYEIERLPATLPDPDEVKAARKRAAAAGTAARALKGWFDGPERKLSKARDALQGLAIPLRDDSAIELLRTAELHGDGLVAREDGAGDGDLLVTGAAEVWVAAATEDGKVTHAVGLTEDGKGGPRSREDFGLAYRWAPAKERRTWTDGSPNYADLDAAMVRLVRLWGESETGAGRSVGNAAGFLAELLDAAGLPGQETDDPDLYDTLAHLRTRGAGAVVYVPGETDVLAGDVAVLSYGGLGVVTRVGDDGAVRDLLLGGQPDGPGRVGEPESAMRLWHDADPTAVTHVWRPSAEPRKWQEDPVTSDVFADLDAALNHLVSFAGRGTLTRGEKSVTVLDLNGLALGFGLLLERGATPAARAAWSRFALTGDADNSHVRDLVYSHGEPATNGPAKPGDVVGWGKGEAQRWGIALADGAIFTTEDDTFTILERKVEITERWTPSLQRRQLDGDGFYGDTLVTLVETRSATDRTVHVKAGGDTYMLDRIEDVGLAGSAAAGAPAWIAVRILQQDDVAGIRRAVDTLGEGLRKGGEPPAGAWVFGRGGTFGIVIADGVMARANSDAAGYTEFVPVTGVDAWWAPSTKPRAYVGKSPKGWRDLDAAIGMLRLWDGADSAELLFTDDGLLDADVLDEAAVKRLRRGPDYVEEWPEYLGDPATGAAEPGDLLVWDDERCGIALDGGEALQWDGSTLSVGKVGKARRWPVL